MRPPPRNGSRRGSTRRGRGVGEGARGCVDDGAELPVPQPSQEEDDDDPDKVEDQEASATKQQSRRWTL
jgi:hypothetical protein